MAQNVETGCLRPVASTDTFVVSTSRVEEWIQRQVNAATALAKKNEKEAPPVNLTLFTLKSSDKFYPFVIVLPEEALVKSGRSNEEELSIFKPEESQGTERILPHIWKVISAYMYTSDDKKIFHSNNWRHDLELSANTAHFLATCVMPRTQVRDNARCTIMLLDPLRVFYGMAKEASDTWKDNFQIEIVKVDKNQGTDYSYRFDKVPRNPRGKKSKDALANDIERMLMAAARRGTK